MERIGSFVDGAWTDRGADPVPVLEAATGEALGEVVPAGPEEVSRAVAAAGRAGAGWAATPPAERADVLDRFAAALTARARVTATEVSRENGMPIRQSVAANGHGAAVILGYYAGLIRDGLPDDHRSGPLARSIVRRLPIGTVAAITPWNYPQALAAMKLGPALAAGCPVVLKPAPETTLDAVAFAEASLAAGLPPGVLGIVAGGRETGAALIAEPDVAKVAFTGSTGAGRAIGAECGSRLRPVTLELGGKSASIVCDDADLDLFARSLPAVSLANNGQTCHACTRILVPRSRYDELLELVTETVRVLPVGDPLDRGTAIGPLVSEAQQRRVLGMVEAGRTAGARITTGGGVPAGLERGWFVEPTVVAGVDNSAAIAREEIFGPVLCVIPYADTDDAVRIANDSPYGLGGTVWTADTERGVALAARVESGTVGVNHYALDPNAPFGGVKDSGLGRELGPEGLAPYLSVRSVYLPPAA